MTAEQIAAELERRSRCPDCGNHWHAGPSSPACPSCGLTLDDLETVSAFLAELTTTTRGDQPA